MSGQFSNLHYDESFFLSRLDQSVKPLQYRLYVGQKRNSNKALPLYGPYYKGDRFDSKNYNQVDIETRLKRQNRPFGSGRDRIHLVNIKQKNRDVPTVGPKFMNASDSLLTHPKQHFRELSVPNYWWDLQRPQSAFIYWDVSQNTRLAAKDAYRTKWPKPLDMNSTLPPGQRSYKNSH